MIGLIILVIGSNGQLGRTLMSTGRLGFDVLGAQKDVSGLGSQYIELDIQDWSSIEQIVSDTKPEVVINAAAMTDVDACERDPEMATVVNAHAPRKIAEACNNIGARMIQVSTDYIFDGKEGMYDEDAPPSPIQEYGRTKLEGERGAKEALGRDLTIVRPSVVFSDLTKNFVSWIVESLIRGESLRIVNDQFVTPTSTNFLAESIFELIKRKESGVWNICSSNRLSRFEMATIVADKIGKEDASISPIKMDDLGWNADRPMDSSLDCGKSIPIVGEQTFREMMNGLFVKTG